MTAVKLLVAAESNSGKTTLTKDLKDALVINHDGKQYPFKVPHRQISDFQSIDELIDGVSDAIGAYKKAHGAFPKTIVFDSVSKIFTTIGAYCRDKYKNFDIHTNIAKDIDTFLKLVETVIVPNGVNVVFVSHAMLDKETERYVLVGATGAFKDKGGILSEVDESIFIQLKNKNRIIHYKSTKFPARTLQAELPDDVQVEDFSLQKHIELLQTSMSGANEFAL